MARSKRVPGEKPLFWIGSAKSDLLDFPEVVKDEIGVALSVAQFGGKHPSASRGRARGRAF
jgi:phage-related protein